MKHQARTLPSKSPQLTFGQRFVQKFKILKISKKFGFFDFFFENITNM